MSAKKKAQATNEQADLALAHAANKATEEEELVEEEVIEVSEDERPSESPQVEAIIKYLRSKAQPDIDRALLVLKETRTGLQRKKVEHAEAAFLAAKKALAELEGEDFTEGANPEPIRRKRGPNKPRADQPTVDQVVAYLKNQGATSKATAVGKASIAKHVNATAGQWAKVIKDAIESKRVASNGGNRRAAAYFVPGK